MLLLLFKFKDVKNRDCTKHAAERVRMPVESQKDGLLWDSGLRTRFDSAYIPLSLQRRSIRTNQSAVRCLPLLTCGTTTNFEQPRHPVASNPRKEKATTGG